MSEAHQPDLQAENARLLAELQAQRAARESAERRADSYEMQISDGSRRLASAQVQQAASQEEASKNAIASIDEELSGLKRQKVTLMQEGKFDEAADLDEKMAVAAARREQARSAQQFYATQRTQLAAQPTDPVEKWLAERPGQYSAQEQEWIKQHRRYVLDPDFQGRVVAAHNEAVGDLRLTRGTPEYYAHLEKRGYMRADQPAETRTQTTERDTQQQQQQQHTESGDAPSGYIGDDGQAADDQPEIIIQEPTVEKRPENPQPRAAGPGAIRSAIAGAPSHRSAASPSGRRVVLTMTPDEKETALAMAPHMAPDDVLKAGEAAVLAWYNELKNSPTARRIKSGWGG